ncbi:MAG: DUF4288 domain-containing protein [Phycisphaerales bacterium]|nr:DUF4288 domain-containing protein [Phycisphaerales bacterium]
MKNPRKVKYEWYGAKTLYEHIGLAGPKSKKKVYEERVVVFRAKSAEEAIDLAEEEAREYAAGLKGVRYLNYVMVYIMSETVIRPGMEVYSLMRQMDLKPRAFMGRYHDAKSERAHRVKE